MTGLVAETTANQTPPDVTPAPQSRGNAESVAHLIVVATCGISPGTVRVEHDATNKRARRRATLDRRGGVPGRSAPVAAERVAGRPAADGLPRLFAGAATLLLLLGVVWISAQGGGDKDELICTEIAPADARAAVFGGQVQRINILVDKDDPLQQPDRPPAPLQGRHVPADSAGRRRAHELLGIIGAVNIYNKYSDASIRIHYQTQNIELELLITPTPTTSRPRHRLQRATETPTALPPTMTATHTPPPATATRRRQHGRHRHPWHRCRPPNRRKALADSGSRPVIRAPDLCPVFPPHTNSAGIAPPLDVMREENQADVETDSGSLTCRFGAKCSLSRGSARSCT